MKKKILRVLGIIALCFIVYMVIWYIRLPEYEIFQSMAISADNFRRDDIRVIVYKNYDSEEMFKRIEDEVNWLAGEPNTQIVLRLYHSKKEVKEGSGPYTTIFIDYSNDTYKITKK